ncbi:MFS transporter [Archangium violaceum]|uniref:Major facilitator transporter n=1 Tax=Archangium violaceum Cb vi76 TaxID=1406225 RepID=A0A084SJX7_9BACT|nr:MFS transporter [Archangium violaceum]KFA88762.1 major facilitator transporter [Archangium violaceum Cb vi76]
MSRPPEPSSTPAAPRPGLLALSYLAFVSLGLPDAVIGVAWPSVRETFSLPQAALGAALAMAASAYFTSGLFAGRFMRTAGIGTLLAVSTALAATGVTGYGVAPAFALFITAACFVGLGSGAIDTGLNTYAAHHFGARHMTWLHAAYSVGAALGPVLMTALLTHGAGWRAGYAVIGGALALLAVAFTGMRRQWDAGPGSSPPTAEAPAPVDATSPTVTAGATLRRPRVWLQIAIFFLYSGVEVTAGQWSYTVLTEARGLGTALAGTWVSLYWAGLLAGRIVLGFVVERMGPVRLLRLGTAGTVVGALLLALPAVPAVLGLALLGFSLAPIFPALMSETPRRVGADAAAHAVGFQVSAATMGVAVVPSAAGLIGERLGLAAITPLILGVAVLLAGVHEVLVALADRPTPPGSGSRQTAPRG